MFQKRGKDAQGVCWSEMRLLLSFFFFYYYHYYFAEVRGLRELTVV